MIDRRKVVKGIVATGLAVAMPSVLRAQELRKIRMGFGIKSVNPIVINILISEQLGYTREEGLSFTPAALGTNAKTLAINRSPPDSRSSALRMRCNGSGRSANGAPLRSAPGLRWINGM